MLKKIAFAVLLALPMGAFAQSPKFGHINAQEVITVMPEYTQAVEDLKILEKTNSDELVRMNQEFNKEYQEFLQQQDSLPANIAARRQKHLEDLMQNINEFRTTVSQEMEKAQMEKMAPIQKKLTDAIKAVGEAEGVIYIFDLSSTPIPYVNETQSTNLTEKVKAQLGIK